MKLIRLPNNTLVRIKGNNYYLPNKDPRIMLMEGKTDDDEVERILSFEFLKDIDPNFEVQNDEIHFCGSKFPTTIISKYLKEEISEKVFTALINGWRNGSRGVKNVDQLEKLQSFLDNNTPIVDSGLIYLTKSGSVPKFGDIPIVISYGDSETLNNKDFVEFAREYYPDASKKFMNKLVKKVFVNDEEAKFSYLYLSAFIPVFGWDKVVHLFNECHVVNKWDKELYDNVLQFSKNIKHKRNAMSFYNFFKKSKEIHLDFVKDKEVLDYWSEIDFDKIKTTEDIKYIKEYMDQLKEPNKPTNYDQNLPMLKEPFIDDLYLHLPKDTHELATLGFELRNCIGNRETHGVVLGVLKRKGKPYAALQFHQNYEFRLKHNKDPDKDLDERMRKHVKSFSMKDFMKRRDNEPRSNA